MDAQSRKLVVYNKELGTIKNNQIEKKNTINEMKNIQDGINSRV